MRLLFTVLAALALSVAAPASAQQGPSDKNGPDNTAEQAAQLDQQKHWAAQASAAMRAGDWKTARKHAQRLADAAPQNLSAQLMLGEAQRGMEDWKGARRTYAAAVRLSPSSPEARTGYGIALGRTGDKDASKQLMWLTERAKACGNCSTLTRMMSDVEAAMAAGPKGD